MPINIFYFLKKIKLINGPKITRRDARCMTMLLFYEKNTVFFLYQFIVLPLRNTFQEKSHF